MAEQFPDITSKLNNIPQKKSLFERNKAEAEAKRQRDEAETAAALTDFVKSFDDDSESGTGNAPTQPRAFGGEGYGARGGSGPPKRHFGGLISRKSGPGSLGPTPHAPHSLSKKRTHDGMRIQDNRTIFRNEDEKPAGLDATTAFAVSSDEEGGQETQADDNTSERAPPKPTIQLSNLPPASSPAFVTELIPSNLKVFNVRVVTPQEPSGMSNTARRSMSAIVTLAQDTPASEIDSTVNSLQNIYLGWGYYLSLSRHLSSAAVGNFVHSNATTNALPFNARAPPRAQPDHHFRGRPPPGQFAPPESYDTPSNGPGRGLPSKAQVQVQAPSDINQLKLIHKTVESLLTHGPDFESLLMTRPEVQRDEKWAWLWDSRSAAGVYYRWRIWELMTGQHAKQTIPGQPKLNKVFEGEPLWLAPESGLPFEFTTDFDEFVSESAYDSSEEDESDSDGDDNPRKRRRQMQHANAPPAPIDANADILEKSFMNPLHRAKLTHLLSRLPSTQAKLRRGDVARVTIFAIKHASEGAEDIIDMLVSNVLRPFASSTSGKQEQELAKLVDSDRYSRSASPPASIPPDPTNNGASTDHNDANADTPMHDVSRPPSSSAVPGTSVQQPLSDSDLTQPKDTEKKHDTSAASLISLHLISDILSASSTSGIRHAWRYRSLFESALRRYHVFSALGRLDRDLKWGRLKAEKWKRSLQGVLGLWEGWSVFETGVVAGMRKEIEEVVLSPEEREAEREGRERDEGEKRRKKGKGSWKTVGADGPGDEIIKHTSVQRMDVDVPPADSAGTQTPDPTADASTLHNGASNTSTNQRQDDSLPKPKSVELPLPGETAAAAAKRRRPRAMDMLDS